MLKKESNMCTTTKMTVISGTPTKKKLQAIEEAKLEHV